MWSGERAHRQLSEGRDRKLAMFASGGELGETEKARGNGRHRGPCIGPLVSPTHRARRTWFRDDLVSLPLAPTTTHHYQHLPTNQHYQVERGTSLSVYRHS